MDPLNPVGMVMKPKTPGTDPDSSNEPKTNHDRDPMPQTCISNPSSGDEFLVLQFSEGPFHDENSTGKNRLASTLLRTCPESEPSPKDLHHKEETTTKEIEAPVNTETIPVTSPPTTEANVFDSSPLDWNESEDSMSEEDL